MGDDNLFLLKRQFSLLLGKRSQGSIFLSTQREINRFCLKNVTGEVQCSWRHSLATVGSTLGVPMPIKAHSGWVGDNAGAVMGNPGSAVRITGKTPLFFQNTGLHEHL